MPSDINKEYEDDDNKSPEASAIQRGIRKLFELFLLDKMLSTCIFKVDPLHLTFKGKLR